jgi:hypothetical protein
MDVDALSKVPCTICSGHQYTWGRIVGDSQTRFVPLDEDLVKRIVEEEHYWLFGRFCEDCGNVQVFGAEDFEWRS